MGKRINWNEDWFFHDGDLESLKAQTKGPAVMQAKTQSRVAGPFSVYFPDQPDHRVKANEKIENAMISFKKVNLPHDYIIAQTPDGSIRNDAIGGYDYHPAFYRKHYTFSSEDRGKRIVLYFEGITDFATIYFNGIYMLDHREAHTPFEVDLTDFVKFDEDNVLAIRVESGVEGGWWYLGGGINRNVWLEISEPVSVNRYGVYVHPEKEEKDEWKVPVETEIRNDGYEPVDVLVQTDILTAEGKILLSMKQEMTVPDREVKTLKQEGSLQNPALWDIDSPILHRVHTRVFVKNEISDERETCFGFREFHYTVEEGFFLNGRNVKIKGVATHADCGLTGIAVEESLNRYRARLIKEMGANAFRCSHYLHTEAFMDELDKLGILCMDEVRWFSSAPHGMSDLEIMIRRDRNHPGIIMWSIGNEEPLFAEERGDRIARSMRALIKKLDRERAIVAAVSHDPVNCTMYEDCDIVGINYNRQHYDEIHRKHPNMPVVAAEHTATGNTRGWYAPTVAELGKNSAYDHDTSEYFKSREFYWQFIYDRPWVMGGFQWTAFEFRGTKGWPRLSSVAGAIDLYLLKKDSFYQNQSFFLESPMIHLMPHWNFRGQEGRIIRVVAYTNCEEAELFLNGRSLGRVATPPVVHAEWAVPYEPGKLEVVGYRNHQEAARDIQETTKNPVRLVLRAENAYDAGPKEQVVLTCYAVDEDGKEVKNAEIKDIQFFTDEGAKVIATGSDNTEPIPPHIPVRNMCAGKVSVLIRLSAENTATVYAESYGYIGAVLTVRGKEDKEREKSCISGEKEVINEW